MANRYWVGGTGNWFYGNTANWSDSSGGSGGFSVPTSNDDVFFDGNSGGGTVTNTYDVSGRNIDFTGFTGTFTGTYFFVCYGNLTLGSGMTWSHSGIMRLYAQANTDNYLRLNGVSISTIYQFQIGSTVQQCNAMHLTETTDVGQAICYVTNADFLTDGYTFKVGVFACYSGNVYLGASTIEIQKNTTGVGMYIYCNVDGGTSTIKMTGTGTATVEITANRIADLYNFWHARPADGWVTLGYSINFNGNFKVDPGKKVIFRPGINVYASTWTLVGTAGNLITLAPYSSSNYYLETDQAVIACDYISYSRATVTGENLQCWYDGENSTDGGNNVGWQTSFTNGANAYSSDNSYATATASDGNLFAAVSKDGGLTWSNVVWDVFFGGSDTVETFGDGESELWGSSWTGDQLSTTLFRVIIFTETNAEIYKGFAFTIGASDILTGLEITAEGKYSGGTTSVDQILASAHYGDATSVVQAGSIAFASDGRKAGEGAGSGTGVQVFHDGSNWIAVDTGSTVAA